MMIFGRTIGSERAIWMCVPEWINIPAANQTFEDIS